jgi:molybdopterin-guanine dinucleotide biosynthesis protein A
MDGAADGRAGYLLAGGQSSRMGRDKALLPVGNSTLAAHIAAQIREAAGNVTLIGPPEHYAHLGFPVIPDAIPGCGPLGGLLTALRSTSADWNLIVACDMPHLTAAFLDELFDAAEAADPDCVVAESKAAEAERGRRHPLCAVYHRRVLAAAETAIDRKLFKMHDFIASLRTEAWPVLDPTLLRNVNTPADWEAA